MSLYFAMAVVDSSKVQNEIWRQEHERTEEPTTFRCIWRAGEGDIIWIPQQPDYFRRLATFINLLNDLKVVYKVSHQLEIRTDIEALILSKL